MSTATHAHARTTVMHGLTAQEVTAELVSASERVLRAMVSAEKYGARRLSPDVMIVHDGYVRGTDVFDAATATYTLIFG